MTIPVLPDPPSRADPANFVTRADAWNAAMQTFSEEISLLGANYEASVVTVLAGLDATLWTAGTYAIGTLKFSTVDGQLYRRLIATASAVDPTADTTNWALQTVAAPTLLVVSGATHTAVKGQHVEMTNAGASVLTFPPSPDPGDWLWWGFTNGRRDNEIDGNGEKIMGLLENYTSDWPNEARISRYISAAYGWRHF